MKRFYVTTLKMSVALFLISLLFIVSPGMSHPLKLSASLVEYDPETKGLHMECKVFLDDFERSLSRAILKGKDPSSIPKADKSKIVNAFFGKYYTIVHNGNKIGQGKANVCVFLNENADIATELERKIREKELGKVTAASDESDTEINE